MLEIGQRWVCEDGSRITVIQLHPLIIVANDSEDARTIPNEHGYEHSAYLKIFEQSLDQLKYKLEFCESSALPSKSRLEDIE